MNPNPPQPGHQNREPEKAGAVRKRGLASVHKQTDELQIHKTMLEIKAGSSNLLARNVH